MGDNHRCGFGWAWCDSCCKVRRHHVVERDEGYLWQCWVDGDEHFTDTKVPLRPPPGRSKLMGPWMSWFRPRSVPVRSVEERRLYLRDVYRIGGILMASLGIAFIVGLGAIGEDVRMAGAVGAAGGMINAGIYLYAYRRIRQPYGEAVIRDELRWHGWDRKAANVLSKSLANDQGAETATAAIHGVQSSHAAA